LYRGELLNQPMVIKNEFVQFGYVDALESFSLGERHFLDVQIMPLGEAHLRNLYLLKSSLSKE
jgi:hypothetical protein